MSQTPIIYFDRCVGTAIPEALRLLDMKNVAHHHIHPAKVGLKPERGREKLFLEDTSDDEWLAFVAEKNWIAITQDYSMHREPATLAVIKQHKARVFYLWGAEARKDEVMRVFLNNRRKIMETAAAVPGPFVFRVKQRGAFERIDLDGPQAKI